VQERYRLPTDPRVRWEQELITRARKSKLIKPFKRKGVTIFGEDTRAEGRSRSGKRSEWFPGELLKCFRDERFSRSRGKENERSSWFRVIYRQRVSARARAAPPVKPGFLRAEHVAIHGLPYELPDQNSSPKVPPGSQDGYQAWCARRKGT